MISPCFLSKVLIKVSMVGEGSIWIQFHSVLEEIGKISRSLALSNTLKNFHNSSSVGFAIDFE